MKGSSFLGVCLLIRGVYLLMRSIYMPSGAFLCSSQQRASKSIAEEMASLGNQSGNIRLTTFAVVMFRRGPARNGTVFHQLAQ